MRRFTFEALEKLGAPLEPLRQAKRALVCSPAGTMWHHDPDAGRIGNNFRPSCAHGKAAAKKAGSKRRELSVATIITEGLTLCEARGCSDRASSEQRLITLAVGTYRAVEAFDRAVSRHDWVAAADAHGDLERLLTRPWTPEQADELNAAQQDSAALYDWADALVAPRTAVLAEGLSRCNEAAVAAIGAFDVPFMAADAATAGVAVTAARAAHAVWREATEALEPPEALLVKVQRAAADAAARLDLEPPGADALMGLVRRWDAQAQIRGTEDPSGPSFAVIVRHVSRFCGGRADEPASWQALVAGTHPTVTNREAAVTLIGARLAERIRFSILEGDTDSSQVLVTEADPETFGATAQIALGLWDRSHRAAGDLAAPAGAWDAASVIASTSTAAATASAA